MSRPSTQAEGIERLKTLYSVLAGIPDGRLNLNSWMKGKTRYDAGPLDVTKEIQDCGTLFCSLGWAAVYPPFMELGLHLEKSQSGVVLPYFGNHHSNFSAASAFFGISFDDAKSLFMPVNEYPEKPEITEELGAWPNHKRLALARLRHYLMKRNAITVERANELKELEENGNFTWSAA